MYTHFLIFNKIIEVPRLCAFQPKFARSAVSVSLGCREEMSTNLFPRHGSNQQRAPYWFDEREIQLLSLLCTLYSLNRQLKQAPDHFRNFKFTINSQVKQKKSHAKSPKAKE